MSLTISDDVPPIEPDEPQELTGERICQSCGLPISDELSGGRRRKYHDECRPKQQATTGKSGRAGGVNIDNLIQQMGSFYRNVGIGVTFLPTCQPDGMAITVEAGNLAESWRPLIEQDKRIRDLWVKITTGSGWGTMIMVHGGLALTIASHHGFQLPGMKAVPQQEVPADE